MIEPRRALLLLPVSVGLALAAAAPTAATAAPTAAPVAVAARTAGAHPAATVGSTAPAATARAAGRSPAAVAATPADWPQYHRDGVRSGRYPSMSPVRGHLRGTMALPLDGAVYASPLVVKGLLIVATENNTVYGIRGRSIVWRRHLGPPVPLSSLPCGNIDPLGITGTPVYDPASGQLFVAAELNTPIRHNLYALSLSTGAVRWARSIDAGAAPSANPQAHQQRAALAISHGFVWTAFGGLAGDCGPYIGTVVGVNIASRGRTTFSVPTTREAGIWAPSGPAVDSAGRVYVSVGNGASTTTYDGSDSIIKLSGTSPLQRLDFFAPSTWASDNAADLDLGSTGPTLIGRLVYADGKSRNAYTASLAHLGGVGGQSRQLSICASFGGTAHVNSTGSSAVYVPCTDGVRRVEVTQSTGDMRVVWHSVVTASQAVTGSPVIGGGVLFALDTAHGSLYELNLQTGAVVARTPTTAVTRFATPALFGNTVYVGTTTGIRGWAVN
jgi:hypothetical protein